MSFQRFRERNGNMLYSHHDEVIIVEKVKENGD